ncbi:MAG: SpaH/EbpB family LPXTG-anchored major pilin [Cellulomonadaceae bacterium]|nr:SpaH/EbpB family LPXTG-anchored major pilin [Cellulomonadaceae bacterium]
MTFRDLTDDPEMPIREPSDHISSDKEALMKSQKRIGAAFASLATAAFLAVALTPAQAAFADATAALPDSSRNGSASLTIMKTADSEAGAANDGTQDTNIPCTPESGVTFSIQQVESYNDNGTQTDLDLTTDAGWTAAAALTMADVTASSTVLGTAVEQSTDDTCQAVFSGLAFGVYYVTQTSAAHGDAPSAPFLVTVPMTNPDGDGWLYDVYAYPKNDAPTINKSVDASAAKVVGDTLTYTVVGSLPKEPVSDGVYQDAQTYGIVDPLVSALQVATDDQGNCNTDDVTVSFTDPTVDGATAQTLTSDDYTCTVGTVSDTDNVLTVTLTATGLAKTGAAVAAGQGVSLVFAAKVLDNGSGVPTGVSDPDDLGAIYNTAYLAPNNQAFTNWTDYGTESNQQETDFGGVTVFKTGTDVTSDSKTAADFNGATFRVYPTLDDAKAGTNAITLNAKNGEQVTDFIVGPEGTNTDPSLATDLDAAAYQNEDGQAVICGLIAGTYYLVETQAPAGYELAAEPVEFTLTHDLNNDKTWDEVSTTTQTQVSDDDITVVDIPMNAAGFHMPLTGWDGMQTAMIVGALAMIAAATMVVKSRRDAKATPAAATVNE